VLAGEADDRTRTKLRRHGSVKVICASGPPMMTGKHSAQSRMQATLAGEQLSEPAKKGGAPDEITPSPGVYAFRDKQTPSGVPLPERKTSVSLSG
jgi:hypothetical protein